MNRDPENWETLVFMASGLGPAGRPGMTRLLSGFKLRHYPHLFSVRWKGRAMPQKSIRQALNEALRPEMRRAATLAVSSGKRLAGA